MPQAKRLHVLHVFSQLDSKTAPWLITAAVDGHARRAGQVAVLGTPAAPKARRARWKPINSRHAEGQPRSLDLMLRWSPSQPHYPCSGVEESFLPSQGDERTRGGKPAELAGSVRLVTGQTSLHKCT